MRIELGGGGGFPGTPPSLGYAYAPIEENRKGIRKFSTRFLAFPTKTSTVQKIVLSSSREQGNFRGLKGSRPRPKPRTSKCVLEVKYVLEDFTSVDWYSGHFEVKRPINSLDANAVICYLREWFVNNAVCDYF